MTVGEAVGDAVGGAGPFDDAAVAVEAVGPPLVEAADFWSILDESIHDEEKRTSYQNSGRTRMNEWTSDEKQTKCAQPVDN